MRIVFPTVENLSYMSEVASSVKDANYFTVLNLSGQTISSVEMLENRNEDIVKLFKKNSFNALVTADTTGLPVEDLKKVGVSIFKEKNRKKVLALYSDFVQDKLTKI
ncbi:hypothetical protein CP960_03025 [Malaciobacter halophilus]|uniref:Dinitrogenase iron-molybdenum cofactor biosynthesis domain-containing protein n=1 Tax=Malaciobacter halophilus TaxID=197482 RepID=A0A2N1J5E1_9BACT|nr:hypothetical protein [Malaciobacter halophilus]AXH10331.1 hypothetical protein AHALO_1989 [Malaciobacter halophilus]PKI81682.1 hypothetical protein CP960_03025 [Malaciobacter halophilus]